MQKKIILNKHFRKIKIILRLFVSVEQRIKLNTPGLKDGSMFLFIDDEKVLAIHNLNFRSTAQTKIQGLLYDTRFGGGSPPYARYKI